MYAKHKLNRNGIEELKIFPYIYPNARTNTKNTSIVRNKRSKGVKETTENSKKLKLFSIYRTINKILDYCNNNFDQFNTFITLTFAENTTNIDFAYKQFRQYIRRCRNEMNKLHKNLYYLAVPEIQKRGSIHFHILTNIPIESKLIPKRDKKLVISHGKRTYIEYYDILGWNNGYSTAFNINPNDIYIFGKYVSKYMIKEIKESKFFSRQKILHSRNLKMPLEVKIYDESKIKKIYLDMKENLIEHRILDNLWTSYELVKSKKKV